jgi:signal transduction histidine kinase
MKLSLPARAFGGNALIVLLLGSVTIFSILAMERGRQQLSLIRSDLMPIGALLERSVSDCSTLISTSKRSGASDEALLQSLRSFNPFGRLAGARGVLETVGRQGKLPAAAQKRLARLAVRIGALEHGRMLAVELARVEGRAPMVLPASANNRELFQLVLDSWEEAARRAGPDTSVPAYRAAARASLKILLRSFKRLSVDYNQTMNLVWTLSEQQERRVMLLAVLLAAAALLSSVLLSVLILRWLSPIRSIRELAYRIAQGEYLDSDGGQVVTGELGQLEADLRRMAGKLHKREEMIRSQSEELLRSERLSAIGKMSTQIAHEIRNPLNAIGLRLEMLDESIAALPRAVDKGTMENLQAQTARLAREVERLTEVTEYYLKFARFPRPQKEDMDLAGTLDDLLGFYSHEAQAAGVALAWEFPQRPLPLRADNNLLKQAMLNLLKNSVEAFAGHPCQAPAIQVRAWAEGDLLRIKVEDNGPGMDEATVARIFDPFFTTKDVGTGLGLTLVQQILREHGGDILCSSRPGAGTAFLLSLPRG